MKNIVLILLIVVTTSCTFAPRSNLSVPRIPQNDPASISHPPSTAGTTIEAAPIPLTPVCIAHIQRLQAMQGMKYGWVQSTELPNTPDSAPVYTFYYHYPTRGVPVIFFNGGPLADSYSAFASLWSIVTTYKTWLIFMDQRGTGCSSPLPEKTKEREFEYMHWGSVGIVRDAEEVRKALKFKRWYIYGQSFGAQIVQRYLQLFPESILTAVAHGGALLNNTFDSSRLRTEQQIHVIKKYFELYPGDLDLIKKITTQHLCDSESGNCGSTAVFTKALTLIGFRHAWDYLHTELLRISLSTTSRPPWKNQRPPNEVYQMANTTYTAHLWVTHPDITDTQQNCYAVRRSILRIIGRTEALAFSECSPSWGDQFPQPTAKDVQNFQTVLSNAGIPMRANETIRANLEKYPDVNFYLFSSEFDYYTPPPIISRAAREIGPRAQYKKLMGVGHEAFAVDAVLRRAIPGLDEIFKAYGVETP